jgi:DNA-binding transcriptional MerR regulator
MNWTIPGTVLEDRRSGADQIDSLFSSLFLAGGLTLSQVSSITGLESHTIQNWVKRGFLAPPRGKKYDLEQLCRIINLNLLKGSLPLEQCCGLMTYINGCLADESDDLVPDSRLYFMFVRLTARARQICGPDDWDEALQQITADYREPVPGAREKLIKVLKIMITVWMANSLRTAAEKMMEEL